MKTLYQLGLSEQQTENPRVGGSIPPLATNLFNDLRQPMQAHFVVCNSCVGVRANEAWLLVGCVVYSLVRGVYPVSRALSPLTTGGRGCGRALRWPIRLPASRRCRAGH